MGEQDVHGWITAALLRETAGLDERATFVNVERASSSSRVVSAMGALKLCWLWLKMAMLILWSIEKEWTRKKGSSY